MLACAAGLEDWSAFDNHAVRLTDLLAEQDFADPDCAWAAGRTGELASVAGETQRAAAAWNLAAAQWRGLGREAELAETLEALAALEATRSSDA